MGMHMIQFSVEMLRTKCPNFKGHIHNIQILLAIHTVLNL